MADEHNDLLTEEEIAAIEAEEGADIDGSASLTGEDTDEWKNAGWGGAEEATGADDAAAEAEAAAQQAAEPEPEPQPAPTPTPNLSEFDQKIADLRAQEAELFDQYDDGDLSREELMSQREALTNQITDLAGQKALAADKVNAESERWNAAVNDYFKDYAGLKDESVISAFDQEVRAVTANPILANKPFREQLEIAHERLTSTARHMGITVPPLKGGKAEEPAGKKIDTRGDDMHTPPPTLARAPASEITGDDSPYAGLERIMNDENVSPEDKEAALARLTPEERDRFSSMA